MPIARADHDGGVSLRIESCRDLLLSRSADFLFDRLAFPVLHIQQRG